MQVVNKTRIYNKCDNTNCVAADSNIKTYQATANMADISSSKESGKRISATW
jgi:hypothetical protein